MKGLFLMVVSWIRSGVLPASVLVVLSIALRCCADESPMDSVSRDRAAYAGTWRVITIEADGKQQDVQDRQIVVMNHHDGSWTLAVAGREVSSGTSHLDPSAQPPQIDLVITAGDGSGSTLRGVYALAGDRRRLCFRGSDSPRPDAFVTAPGTKAILVEFEREDARSGDPDGER